MRLRMLAFPLAALMCAPAIASAQPSSMFSNLANPAIGMNALFSGQAAHNLEPAVRDLRFDEAEISVISVVDPVLDAHEQHRLHARTAWTRRRCGPAARASPASS